MDKSDISNEYPEIDRLLPQNFWDQAEPHHPIILNASEGNKKFFQRLQELIQSVPAAKICSPSQKGNFHTTNEFESALSEFTGYAIVDNWLCNTPSIVDGNNSAGGPEFHCDGIDIEVARLRESREVDRIRSFLSDNMGDGIKLEIKEKNDYNLGVSNKQEWDDNEDTVDDIINYIGGLQRDQLPEKFEIDGLNVRIEERSAFEEIQMIVQTQVKKIDETNDLRYILKKKAKQKYRGNPLVFFIDIQRVNNYPEDQEDVLQEVIGESFADGTGNHTTSRKALNVNSKWQDYMKEIGRIPTEDPVPIIYDESGKVQSYGYLKLRQGNEGVFADSDLSNVAGILFRTGYGTVGYVPNVYTTMADAKNIYDRLGWGTQMIDLENIPDLPNFVRPNTLLA